MSPGLLSWNMSSFIVNFGKVETLKHIENGVRCRPMRRRLVVGCGRLERLIVSVFSGLCEAREARRMQNTCRSPQSAVIKITGEERKKNKLIMYRKVTSHSLTADILFRVEQRGNVKSSQTFNLA